MKIWNPWHGCKKYSQGCKNCYVYRRDESIGKDASIVYKTASFSLPVKKSRKGEYKIPDYEEVYTCMTSDFFIEEADEWRKDIWDIMKFRKNVRFVIITKRIERFLQCIPEDWGEGYPNVVIGCTVENQKECDKRLPVFIELPIKEKFIICEPLLEAINLKLYLTSEIRYVVVGGESGNNARLCDYQWVLSIRDQCADKNVNFYFKQTGANFKKGAKYYRIPRKLQHSQAKKAGIDIQN